MTRAGEPGSGSHGSNVVRLRGRVSSGPLARVLPSGTPVVSFRVVVGRERTAMTSGSTQSSDWVDCTAWGGAVRRTVARWTVGDTVEVEGALRRRFARGATGTSTRLDVEVLCARRVARAGAKRGAR